MSLLDGILESGVLDVQCISVLSHDRLASGISTQIVSSRCREVQFFRDLKSIFSGGLQVPNR